MYLVDELIDDVPEPLVRQFQGCRSVSICGETVAVRRTMDMASVKAAEPTGKQPTQRERNHAPDPILPTDKHFAQGTGETAILAGTGARAKLQRAKWVGLGSDTLTPSHGPPRWPGAMPEC